MLMATDIKWRLLSHHPKEDGGLRVWGSYSFRLVNLTSRPMKVTYTLNFIDEHGLGVGGRYLPPWFYPMSGIVKPSKTELSSNGSAKGSGRFNIPVGSVQEAAQAASMEIHVEMEF